MDCLKYLERNRKEVIGFAQKLVRINSVNGNEAEVARVIRGKLREHGVGSKLFGKGRRKGLYAVIKGGKKSLMLNGHLDTVPPGNLKKWKFRPFSGDIRSGKMYGRGACDMKGGVAALVFSVIALTETKTRLNGDLMLVLTYDEEGGNHTGMRDFLSRGIRTDACVVAEPLSRNSLRLGSRGLLRLELEARGESAHSGSMEHKGVNAVLKMARVLLELEKLKPSYKKHKMFPPPRISPGTVITGGEAINIIPDRCRAMVDCRLSYGQTGKGLLKEIRGVIQKLKREDRELCVRIRELAYMPAGIIDKNEEIVGVSRRCVERVMGFRPRLMVTGAMTDGTLLIEKGIPSVVFGPTGNNIHSENEFVNVESIVQMSKVYASIAADFLGTK